MMALAKTRLKLSRNRRQWLCRRRTLAPAEGPTTGPQNWARDNIGRNIPRKWLIFFILIYDKNLPTKIVGQYQWNCQIQESLVIDDYP